MENLDLDVKNIFKNMIENNWDLDDTDIEVQIQKNKGKSVNVNKNLLKIRETDNRGFNSSDLTRSTYDINIFVNVTITVVDTNKSEKIWSEIIRILTDNDTRSKGLKGGWDYLQIDEISFTDPSWNFETNNLRINFIKNTTKI